MNGPQATWLAGGRRLHLNHGPIDLIIQAFGSDLEKRAAYRQAFARFETVLQELVDELDDLRRPAADACTLQGPTARRMIQAVTPFVPEFITPMAAVAGAVADEVLAALTAERSLEKAYVNNGGDSAIFLEPDASLTVAIAGTGHGFADRITIRSADPVRGLATSGWRGRSHSLGIADAVTVLAASGAAADAAATLIANAVDLPGHPAVERQPAISLSPDSDLGARLVTTAVPHLELLEIARALEAGLSTAEDFRRRGLIESAALFLQGESRICGQLLLEAPLTTNNNPSGRNIAHA